MLNPKYILFFLLGLAVLGSANAAFACREDRSYGTNIIAAQGNCRGILRGQVGDCGPMNAAGTFWYCECRIGCGGRGFEEELLSVEGASGTNATEAPILEPQE